MTAKQPQMPPVKATRPAPPAGPPDPLRRTLEHYQGLLDQSERIRQQQAQVLQLRDQRVESLEQIVHKLARDRFLLDWLDSMQVESITFQNSPTVLVVLGDDRPLRDCVAAFINKGVKG